MTRERAMELARAIVEQMPLVCEAKANLDAYVKQHPRECNVSWEEREWESVRETSTTTIADALVAAHTKEPAHD